MAVADRVQFSVHAALQAAALLALSLQKTGLKQSGNKSRTQVAMDHKIFGKLFLSIGAMKAGTTWLYGNLCSAFVTGLL